MVSLDRFDTFKAVVEAGSLTAAADLLGQTRAVVSFNLKRLESRVGGDPADPQHPATGADRCR